MVQSDQLTTRIPNNSPNSTEIGQQNDNDYPDGREEYLYQVDGTTDIHTPTDHSADDEDTEPDNNTCKRQRKTFRNVTIWNIVIICPSYKGTDMCHY